MLHRGLEQTAALWPPIRIAFGWVHQAALILKNEVGLQSPQVRQQLRDFLCTISGKIAQAGSLKQAVEQFLKVTQSYWPGLFHCYDIAGLPRTNNDLEHVFGQWRHHQRRCTGRKVAPATAVTRGSVQLVAALATQRWSYSALELATVNPAAWQRLRSQLKQHQHKRVQQRRFRQDPVRYLTALEQKFLKLVLPP